MRLRVTWILAWNLRKFSSVWFSDVAFPYFAPFPLLLPIASLFHRLASRCSRACCTLLCFIFFLSTCFSLISSDLPFNLPIFFFEVLYLLFLFNDFNNLKYRYFQFQNYHLIFNIFYFGWNSPSYNMIYIYDLFCQLF